MFKAKTLIEKVGTRYLNRCPDHLSRQFLTTASTFPYRSKNSSAEHIHILSTWFIITNTHTHSHRQTHTHTHSHRQIHTMTHSLTHKHKHKNTHTHTHILTHGGTCVRSVNMFGWGIFGTIWKGRGGGHEFSAEVIRAPGWGSWYPPFRPVFLL